MHLVLSIFIFFSSFSAYSEAEKSRFSAGKYTRKSSQNKIILDDNVRIVNGKNFLVADHVELNSKSDDFTATGNVSFKGDSFELQGNQLQGNMSSPKGTLSDGKIITGKDIIEGEKINRTNRNTFHLEEGRYTSCSNTPPDWRLYGNNIDMTIGEYAFLDNVVVEAFGIPALYIPYLAVPLKKDRQSGLLPPHFGFGSDGFNIHEPLFIALSRSHDMTFTLGHYSNRGLKEGLEFRSAFAEDSRSNLYYFHVKDKKFQSTLVGNEPIGQAERHGLKIDQIFRLSEETYAKTQIRYTSDDDIPRDFPDEIEGNADPALETKLVVMSRTDNAAYTADIAYYENLLSFNPTDNNKFQLQKLPELRFNFAKTKVSALMFEGDISYLNIYRSGLPYDDFNNNGIYDNNEFIRTGQRIDIFPRASLPITTKYLKITPQAGFRYDYYNLPIQGNADRAYGEIRTNVVSEFSKVYKRDETRHYRAIKHTIEPFLDHKVIPSVYQSDHPFFTNKRDEITSPMFDSVDTIGKTHAITYGVTSRMLAKYISNIAGESKIIPVAELPDKNSCSDCNTKESEEKLILSGSSDDFLGIRKEESLNNKTEEAQTNNILTSDDEDFTVLQPLMWKIYQSYNFLDTTGKPFGYLYSDIWASYAWFSLGLQKFYNVYTQKMGISSQVSAHHGSKYISVGYSYDKTEETRRTDQARLGLGFSVWRFGTNARFILNNEIKGTFMDKMQDKYFDVTYNPPSSCWTILVAASDPYDKDGFDITITFNLLISGEAVGFGKDSALFNKF